MKVIVTVDCTPEEARAFMGLPDVTLLNEQLVKQMAGNMGAMSPDNMMAMWAPMMSNMTNFWTGTSGTRK